eukprot:g43375.t1
MKAINCFKDVDVSISVLSADAENWSQPTLMEMDDVDEFHGQPAFDRIFRSSSTLTESEALCVNDDQLVFRMFGEQENPIGVAIPDSFLYDGSFSELGIPFNPCVEISMKDAFIFLRDVDEYGFQGGVEAIFGLIYGIRVNVEMPEFMGSKSSSSFWAIVLLITHEGSYVPGSEIEFDFGFQIA